MGEEEERFPSPARPADSLPVLMPYPSPSFRRGENTPPGYLCYYTGTPGRCKEGTGSFLEVRLQEPTAALYKL